MVVAEELGKGEGEKGKVERKTKSEKDRGRRERRKDKGTDGVAVGRLFLKSIPNFVP